MIKITLFGFPNVGKSSIFNALTFGNSKVGNYDFCTLTKQQKCFNFKSMLMLRLNDLFESENIFFPEIKLADTPGMLENAYFDVGCGKQFLNYLADADVLIHVIDNFKLCLNAQQHNERIDSINRSLFDLDANIAAKFLKKKNFTTYSKNFLHLLCDKLKQRRFFSCDEVERLRKSKSITRADLNNFKKSKIFLSFKDILYFVNGMKIPVSSIFFRADVLYSRTKRYSIVNDRLLDCFDRLQKTDDACGSIRSLVKKSDLRNFEKTVQDYIDEINVIFRQIFDSSCFGIFFVAGTKETRGFVYRKTDFVADIIGKIHSEFTAKMIRVFAYRISEVLCFFENKTSDQLTSDQMRKIFNKKKQNKILNRTDYLDNYSIVYVSKKK